MEKCIILYAYNTDDMGMHSHDYSAIRYTGKKRKHDDNEEEDPSNQPSSKRAKKYA